MWYPSVARSVSEAPHLAPLLQSPGATKSTVKCDPEIREAKGLAGGGAFAGAVAVAVALAMTVAVATVLGGGAAGAACELVVLAAAEGFALVTVGVPLKTTAGVIAESPLDGGTVAVTDGSGLALAGRGS